MEKMHINEKSWHYKFNQWTYGEYYRPSHGCPYFWKTLLAILISPMVLFFKGLTIIPFGRVHVNIETPDWDVSYSTQMKIFKGFKIFLIVLAVSLMMLGYQHDSEGAILMLVVLGLVLASIGACIGLGYVLWKLLPKLYEITWEKYRETHEPREWNIDYKIKLPKRKQKEYRPNPVISMIKGWYDKNCPAIEYY